MYQEHNHTDYPPSDKPVMVWDGQCGFCAYWITNWKKNLGDKAEFRTFQSSAADVPDIPRRAFMLASRWIEPDGSIHGGPKSAFRSLKHAGKHQWLDKWYEEKPWFKKLMDRAYRMVTKNRSFFLKVSKFTFGNDPEHLQPFWLLYISFALAVIAVLSLI